jgi:lysophospholipase L1-like esterase
MKGTAGRLTAECALVVCALIAGLVLAEIGVRLFSPQPMNGSVYENTPRGYAVNRSSGTVLFSVGANNGIYHFTSPHLRGISSPQVAEERILVLGDSFTFGAGLSEEDTYVSRLQKKIEATFGVGRVALLNAGIGGSGTADHLAFLEDFGGDIAPRAVVVFISIDDFNRAERSPLYRLRRTDTLELDEGTVPTNVIISFLHRLGIGSDIYNFLIQHLHIAQLVRRAVIGANFSSSPGPASAWPDELKSGTPSSSEQQRLVRAIFKRMKTWCDLHGAKLAVINNGWRTYNWLPELLASENITFFDAASQIQPVITRDMAAYTIMGDGHPNAKGAMLVADAVWPFIQTFIKEGNLDKSQNAHRISNF